MKDLTRDNRFIERAVREMELLQEEFRILEDAIDLVFRRHGVALFQLKYRLDPLAEDQDSPVGSPVTGSPVTSGTVNPAPVTLPAEEKQPEKKPSKLSPVARARIRAAQVKRWAAFRQAKVEKAAKAKKR